MELRIQPKPEVEFVPANKGIVSKKQFFVKKHLEDVKRNAFPAIFVRPWRSKAEVIFPPPPDPNTIQYECYFNSNIQNHFAEDFAEEAFLRTPPPCFVVFGKRVHCSIELSKKLAEDYGSVLMNVDDIVNKVLEMRTQTSKLLHDILRLGVPLTLNFILALLCYVAHTPEARHRGYVLCGLPTLAFAQDMPAEHQFNYLFTWDNKPTIFIYVLCEDEDLINERAKLKYEVKSSGKESSMLLHFENQEVPEENDETTNPYGIPTKEETTLEPDIDISPSRPRVQLPRDEESRVWTDLELFDAMIKPTIDLIASRMDPQCLIQVDSRLKNSYEIIKSQLLLLPLWKSPMPTPFMSPNEPKTEIEGETEESYGEASEKASDYDEDILRVAEEPPQVAFLTLFAKKTISPKFRWELSHYNYICPVSLREGEVVEGKSRFAVAFLKYIYFLRDQDCVTKFMKNPRAYVLPVKPKPLCRFFILGYPFSGKTTLARILAREFSIPIINVENVLKTDLERKKNTYEDFCRQKAECREMIRLTVLAWQDWRLEEERRVNLIEECILYLQSLLQRRIDQFYSPEAISDEVAGKSKSSLKGVQKDSNKTSRGASGEKKSKKKKNLYSLSAELVESVKEGRLTFNKDEANSYFSFVWKSFSGKSKSYHDGSTSEEEYHGEDMYEEDEDSEDDTHSVNWCDLLPPQSLSSFLISKLPYTTRVKRQSFKIFLEAASKAYHVPSKLKSEFAKWHLPCYMDIPLCGILLENPIFLLKYVPTWLRERPLIPNPVDPAHPSVLAEGEKAFKKASMVVVRQNAEEQAILLRNAIEKAEREGMRVTGEVITPGGWVVDNMTLDPAVWKKLLCEKVFADHVYVLIDSELGNRRIINHWWETYGKNICSRSSLKLSETEGEQPQQVESVISETTAVETEESSDMYIDKTSLVSLLEEWVAANAKGDRQLDEIYEKLKPDIQNIQYFFPPFPVDPFCHDLFQNTLENWNDLKDDSLHEETTFIIHALTGMVSRSLFWSRELTASFTRMPLGSQLETCANALVDFYNTKPVYEDAVEEIKETLMGCLEFFKFLHTLPAKLEQLKGVFQEAGRSETIEEIEIHGKTPEDVFEELVKKLMSPFIKKPRELEDFEIEEIKASSELETDRYYEDEEEEEGELESESEERESTEVDERDDIRIFGESGELCIVSLERNKYLIGKLEYSLRYFGKLYYFWSQECKDKFIENPEKYAPYYSAIRCYPPLKIFVVGPTGSGRTTLSSAIARQCKLAFIDVSKFLCQNLLPFMKPSGEKWDVINKKKLLLLENHNEPAKQLKEKFMRVPYGKRKFWLEHSFHTNYEDNKEMYDVLHKISINPVNFEEFPELKYSCIESVFDTYGEDYMEIQPKASDLPEAPYLSMKEMVSIAEGDGLAESDETEYHRRESLKKLWDDEPFVQSGFILKGYPRRRQDVKQIIEKTWIPDLIIEMVLSESSIISRNVDLLMDEWQIKLKKELAEQEALELALTTIQSNCREIREKELYLERQKLLLAMNSRRYGSVESSSELADRSGKQPAIKSITKKHRLTLDQDEEGMYPTKIPDNVKEEVGHILDKEFPPLVFKPVFETYYSAKERVINSIIKSCRKDMADLEKMKPILNELNIPWLAINGERTVKENLAALFIKLDKMRSREGQKKEFAFPVPTDLAEKLLDQGYYLLSKFGRLCPVQAFLKKNPLHMYRPLSARGKITPIAYRNYIYFVGGEGEKLKFIKNPVKYITNDIMRPNIPVRLAVIGPPKSGKSTLCKRLAVMFDLRVVTMGMALRMALEETPHSTLAKTINSYLRRGCFLPLSLKLEALLMCLTHPSSCTQGYVLDGIPFDAALTQSLAERNKLPYVILSLVVDPRFGKINRERLNVNEFRLPYKQRINLDTRYKDWMDTYQRFAKWNQDSFNNIHELNGKLNSVDIFYQAFDIIKEAFFEILHYVKFCTGDKALSLQYLCVGHQEYLSKRTACGNNCPVCWAEVNRLKHCPESRPKLGLVQYLNHIYWVCSDHLQKFLNNPKMYLPPKVPKWPELLPERVNISQEARSSFVKMVHGYGRCPVTRVDFPARLEWEGSWDFAASYNGKIYLCKNEKMLQRFLAQPWRYCRADTIFEAQRSQKSNSVVNLGPPKLSSLPPIGFLEQTVADLIHESLQNVGSLRPLYPDLHPRVTGCIFVALFLKVHNKRRKACSLDAECLEFFFRNCQASKYKVTLLRPPDTGQGDFEPDLSDDSDSSVLDDSRQSSEFFSRNWPDFETQAAKRMWSAKNVEKEYVEMKLTEKDELQEIPEVPMAVAILRFQYHNLRMSPLPPVDDCLNYIYSIPTKLQLPEKFNYNSLHQVPLQFSSPFTPQILFNPQKEFSQSLFHHKDQGYPSTTNLHQDKRTMSDCSVIDIRVKASAEPNEELMTKGFFPRFQLLDRLTPKNIPEPPIVVEKEPLVLNPHFDHSYMMLFSEFFHTSHYLRCYDLNETLRYKELFDRLDKSLELTTTQIEYIFPPRRTASMGSRTSVYSYQLTFDTVTPFLITSNALRPSEVFNYGRIPQDTSGVSFNEFFEAIVTEKYEGSAAQVTPIPSFDSFEINVVPTNSDVSLWSEVRIHEILAFPPMPWDIISRPYYAYCSIPSIFEKPHIDNIAHERHVSLLDGITEMNEDFKFVPFPTNVQLIYNTEASAQAHRRRTQVHPCHFYFDFFNLPWTSFLTYRSKLIYTSDFSDRSSDKALGDKTSGDKPSGDKSSGDRPPSEQMQESIQGGQRPQF